MTDQEVLSYYGKDVSVTRNDGTVVTGFFCVFIPDFDNDPKVSEVILEVGTANKSLLGIDVPDIDHIDIVE